MADARRDASRAGALVFAWCGAALFAASLVFFLYCYLVRFGAAGSPAPRRVRAASPIDVALFTVFALHHSVFGPRAGRSSAAVAAPGRAGRPPRALGLHLDRQRPVHRWSARVAPVPGELYHLTGAFAARWLPRQAARPRADRARLGAARRARSRRRARRLLAPARRAPAHVPLVNRRPLRLRPSSRSISPGC